MHTRWKIARSLQLSVVAVAATVLLLASSTFAQVPDDSLIVPGLRIGRYSLEGSVEDITQLVGSPPGRQRVFPERDTIMPITGTVGSYTLTIWPLEAGNLGASHRNEHQIDTLQLFFYPGAQPSLFRTDQGIGLRSKRADVELAYGRPTWEHRYGVDARDRACLPSASGCRTFTFTAYNPIGIAFWFEETGLVGAIFIFRPGAAPSIHCKC